MTSDSFQEYFVDICVIVSVKQEELAINMKALTLRFPCCLFVVLDPIIMSSGIVASGDGVEDDSSIV